MTIVLLILAYKLELGERFADPTNLFETFSSNSLIMPISNVSITVKNIRMVQKRVFDFAHDLVDKIVYSCTKLCLEFGQEFICFKGYIFSVLF